MLALYISDSLKNPVFSDRCVAIYYARAAHAFSAGIFVARLVLGRSSIIIDNQSFTSLIMINRLQNWQLIIIGKGDT